MALKSVAENASQDDQLIKTLFVRKQLNTDLGLLGPSNRTTGRDL